LYNHAKDIEQIAESIGIIPGWAKPKTPTEKSEQEGWNGRVKEKFMSTLPGYRGDKKQREGLQAGMTSSNIGLQKFKQLLMKWVYDDYSNTPMADGLTPRQMWHLGMRHSKPRIPRDIWGYRLVPCLHKTLKFRPEGILFCGLIYSAPFLHAIRKRYGHNSDACFRFNPGNLKEIYLHDPTTKAYVPVPCTNPEYASGLSLYQHQLVLKMARENRIRNPSLPQLLLYREELRVLTEQLRYSTKLTDRKRSARTGTVPGDTSTTEASRAFVVTQLEDRILELEEVEMEEEDEGWNLAEVA
jgi:putative transposase